MDLTRKDYGRTPDGQPVSLFELRQGPIVARLTDFGATLTELHVPDRHGKPGDVVLGFDSLEGYLSKQPYLGATIGRVANRVAGGKFSLEGVDYALAVNNGPNSLHGGLRGFDKVVWQAEPAETPSGPKVAFTYTSPDGEEGYPGTLAVRVSFELMDGEALQIEYTATADRATPVNLTNHSYFNLAGPDSGTILDHVLTLDADAYTPVDATLIPTGAISPVSGTPFDFRTPAPIGSRIADVPGGYDHNFVLTSGPDLSRVAARVLEPTTGRLMEVLTTEPGLQFYSGNFLDGSALGKRGVPYIQHAGLCLEAQHFPDSLHHPNFPSILLKPGETYRQTTIYRFRPAT